jgi:hypothetical protein
MSFLDKITNKKSKNDNIIFPNSNNEISANGSIEIIKNINQLRAEQELLTQNKEALKQEIVELEKLIADKKKEILVFDEQLILESYGVNIPKFDFTSSVAYKDLLTTIRDAQLDMVKKEMAVEFDENWITKKKGMDLDAEDESLDREKSKFILRTFNQECDNLVDNIHCSDLNKTIKKILNSYEILNRLGKVFGIRINEHYLKLKLQELNLTYEYQRKITKKKKNKKSKASLNYWSILF